MTKDEMTDQEFHDKAEKLKKGDDKVTPIKK